jgi:hypothetical protein
MSDERMDPPPEERSPWARPTEGISQVEDAEARAAGLSDYITPSAEPVVARRRPGRLIVLLIGVVGILGGAVFAALSLIGDEGSPEEAVRKLFNAMEQEDVLGILEALAPSEREIFREATVDIADQLKRLEILSGDVDLNGIAGLDFAIEDLELSSASITDDIAGVTVRRGTLRSQVDQQRLPLGDFVRDILRDAEVADPPTDSSDIADDIPLLVTVKEDDEWRVSVWYSVAENARRGSGAPAPAFGSGLRAVGAPSPEQVIQEMVEAVIDLDLRAFLELLPPDEARVLHDYAPLFLEEIERAAAQARQNVRIEASGLELASTPAGDRARVKVASVARAGVTFTDPDEEGTSGSIVYEAGCVTLSAGFFSEEPRKLCGEELVTGTVPGFGLGFGALKGPDVDFESPDLAFEVVRRGDRWFLSPTRTMFAGLVSVLRVFDRADLDAIREWFEGLGEQFEAQSEERQVSSGFAEGEAVGQADGQPGGEPPEEFHREQTDTTAVP